jgi:hypothetical protein
MRTLSFHQLQKNGGQPVSPDMVLKRHIRPARRDEESGVWILGKTRDDIRKAGMGIVLEYADQQCEPKWIDPPEVLWSYRPFAHPEAATIQPDHRIPLLFESKFRGHGDFDYWTINGKSYPKTYTVMMLFRYS